MDKHSDLNGNPVTIGSSLVVSHARCCGEPAKVKSITPGGNAVVECRCGLRLVLPVSRYRLAA